MVENKKVRANKNASEAGYGMVIVVVIIFFVCVAVFAALASSMRASRSQENFNARDDEKWAAKSAMATMRRVLEVKLPQKHEAHLTEAQSCLRSMGNPNSTLPVFDEQDAAPESSVPVLLVQPGGSTTCNQTRGYSPSLTYTSLLGNPNVWVQNLVPLWEQDAYSYGYQSEMLKVARLAEQFRRFNSAGDPVYVFGFIIDARGGQHFRIRENGEVALGDVSQNCGATGRLEITPRSVQRGNPVTFQITYTNVNRLRILSRANNLLHEENVTEQPDPQVFSWNYTPTATDSFRVEAVSSNSGCFSRSEWIEVIVTDTPPAPCPVIDSLTATPDSVTSGDVSTIAWATRDAAEVTLEGDIVAPSDTRGYIIPAEKTFTLIARDAANTCPATRQVTVRIILPSCLTPVVSQFTVTPPAVTPGQPVTISWQVDNVMPGGTVNITLPDGTVLNDVGATGNRTVNAPGSVGTYNYSIAVSNPCGTAANAVRQIQVSNSCTPVAVANFSANPSNVVAGGNQIITLSWNASGTIDTQSIDQGIGAVSGNSHTMTQPQTNTTYTLTVTGCNQTVQANVQVVVSSTPTTPPSASCSPPARNTLIPATSPPPTYFLRNGIIYNISRQLNWGGETVNFNLSMWNTYATNPGNPYDITDYARCFSATATSANSGNVSIEYIKVLPTTALGTPLPDPPASENYPNQFFPGMVVSNVPYDTRVASNDFTYTGQFDSSWEYNASYYIKVRVSGQVYYERISIYETAGPGPIVVPSNGVTGYKYSEEYYTDGNGNVNVRNVLRGDF